MSDYDTLAVTCRDTKDTPASHKASRGSPSPPAGIYEFMDGVNGKDSAGSLYCRMIATENVKKERKGKKIALSNRRTGLLKSRLEVTISG